MAENLNYITKSGSYQNKNSDSQPLVIFGECGSFKKVHFLPLSGPRTQSSLEEANVETMEKNIEIEIKILKLKLRLKY